jgi:hypothetical protein
VGEELVTEDKLTRRFCGHYIPETTKLCPTCGSGRWQWVTLHDPKAADALDALQETKEN